MIRNLKWALSYSWNKQKNTKDSYIGYLCEGRFGEYFRGIKDGSIRDWIANKD
jgi:hypothetical protein